MKIFTLLILLVGVNFTSMAQKKWDTEERVYSGGVVLAGLVDVEAAKVLGSKPMGKDLTLKYDPYFDKYTVDWMEVDGPARMILKFKEQNSGGKMYVDSYSSDTEYFIHNNIATENKVTIIRANSNIVEGRKVKLMFVFDDLK